MSGVAFIVKRGEMMRILAVVLLLFTMGTAYAADSRTVESKVNAAADAFQAGSYDEAANLFRQVVKQSPRHVLAWYFLGQSLEKTGKTAEAQKAYSKVLELQPTGEVADKANKRLAELRMNALQFAMIKLPGRNYEIGKYEVTQKLWKEIMGNNPSGFQNCGDNCPVENVSWNDVQEFLAKLNQTTGKQYRLPTESEWEYACYGGSQTEYCGGNDVDAVAWYEHNSGSFTHSVGQKQPNGYGLYDMSGNVDEWVQDKYDNDWRVVRGGSWGSKPQGGRAADRIGFAPADRHIYLGFRLARTLP